MGLDRDERFAWPGVERLFASGCHVGATLLIAWQPSLVIGAVPLPSAPNVCVLALLVRHIRLAMGVIGLVGAAVFADGLAVRLWRSTNRPIVTGIRAPTRRFNLSS